MANTGAKLICVVAILLCVFTRFATLQSSHFIGITIPLNKSITNGDNELYSGFYSLNNTAILRINLALLNKNIDFVIFQAHSHLYNITLYNSTKLYKSSITGTNLGLYSPVKNYLIKDTFFIENYNRPTLNVFVSVHGYRKIDPIPGGGNLEFPILVSPFIYAKYNSHYINVDAQPQFPTNKNYEMVFYRMYLPESNYNEDLYFNAIRSMITKKAIEENGIEVPKSNGQMPMRRMLSAYPGTGSVYVVLVYDVNKPDRYAVYVPTTTYACSPLVEGDCELLDDITSQMFCACLLFVGLFTCFFGHRFFKTEVFLKGTYTGFIITYIIMSTKADLQTSELVGVSLLSGLFFGAIWLLFWWVYGIPVLVVFMGTLQLGFIVAAISYYRLPGYHPMLSTDATFWSLFITVMILTAVVLVTVTYLSNILCCAVIGAYVTVYPIDFYLGSNLKYIIINTVRRAVVDKFSWVVLAPVFQWKDLLVTTIWVMLAISGFLFQHYHNRGRPPFPPPPREVLPRHPVSQVTRRINRYGTFFGRNQAPAGTTIESDPRTPILAEVY